MYRRKKYNVDTSAKGKAKRTFESILFDSESEMKYYRDHLLPLKESGEIVNIVRQPKSVISPKYYKYGKSHLPIYYEADFQVTWADGRVEIIDVKGMATEAAKLKRKLYDQKYPDSVLIWIAYSKLDGGWQDYDFIKQRKAKRKKDKENVD